MTIYQVFGIVLMLAPGFGLLAWLAADGGIRLLAECVLKTAGIVAGAFAYSALLGWLLMHQ